MAKKLKSVFTDDMEHCIYTCLAPVERHHIFGGYSSNSRKYSEEDGFVVPLSPTLHPNGAQAGKDAKNIDLALKKMAQTYFENHYGTREQFIKRYGKSYL